MPTPEELAREASQPGTFNFLDRVRGRNYPKTVVSVFLDEQLGYRYIELQKKHAETKNPATLKKIEAELKEVQEALKSSTYEFHLEGISTESYDALIDQAVEAFPFEYTEYTSPLTGKVNKDLIDNDDRAKYVTALVWAAYIRKIVAPDGAVQVGITEDEVAAMRGQLPFDAQRNISRAIDDLRMAVEWMNNIQDEDFLAKS